MRKIICILLLCLVLVACSAENAEQSAEVAAATNTAPAVPTAAPTATALPTTETIERPTATAETVAIDPTAEPLDPTDAPTAEPEPEIVYGRTAEGAFFVGAESAEVTVIDYSDFL